MSTVAKRIGIVVKADREAEKKADALEAWLQNRQIDVVRKESLAPIRQLSSPSPGSAAPADLRCVLVLGGDGTFLSAVRWIGDQSIPILGIKFGEVGFLAEISEDKLFSATEYILENPFTTEPRMRLFVRVQRDGREFARETVLNDVVINKGALARLATMKTSINDRYLTTYRADGLIVATPTGSTAYSLAAGGPIIHPGVPGIILAPICPFTLTNRPLVVPDTAIIKIELAKKASNIMLTFDGQAGIEINDQDIIIIRKGRHPIQMISMPGQNYFDVLKAKLNWSGYRV
jgi:NAD+ kinase